MPSLNVTVAVPFSDTSTVLAFGFTFLISASTFSFSFGVNSVSFTTGVFAGSAIAFDCASTTVLSGVNVAVVTSGIVSLVSPLFFTTIFVAVGFNVCILAFTDSFSLFVKSFRFLTGVNSGVTIIGTFTSSELPSVYVTLTTTVPPLVGISPVIALLAICSPVIAFFICSSVCFVSLT